MTFTSLVIMSRKKKSRYTEYIQIRVTKIMKDKVKEYYGKNYSKRIRKLIQSDLETMMATVSFKVVKNG